MSVPAKAIGKATLLTVLAVYAAAFVLPALHTGKPHDAGGERVLAGWEVFGLLSLVPPAEFWPVWLANFLFWYGLFQLAKGRWARAYVWAVRTLVFAVAGSVIVYCQDDQGLSPRAGYFLWVGSMGLFAAGARAGLVRAWREAAAPAGR
jgi:hypothetical protein